MCISLAVTRLNHGRERRFWGFTSVHPVSPGKAFQKFLEIIRVIWVGSHGQSMTRQNKKFLIKKKCAGNGEGSVSPTAPPPEEKWVCSIFLGGGMRVYYSSSAVDENNIWLVL